MSLSDKQQAFVNEYVRNGHNATQAYKTAYPNSKGEWDKLGPRLRVKEGIKQAIAEIEAVQAVKQEHDREIAIALLLADHKHLAKAAKAGNIPAIQARTAIVRELDTISGLNKHILIDETEQSRPLTDTDRAELKRLALIATNLRASG